MKKKYFTPEMEEFKYEIPTLMEEAVASTATEIVCTTHTCTAETDPCPWDVGQ